ncbi:MAG TPA: aldo/keto reductase [Sphingomonadaceae bacterium]|nr:aldo/keto reductase [Sphingomonadaceae bacterium]
MEYVRLGRSGLQVSRICLGCMSFGESDRGLHRWTLRPEDGVPILRRAVEAGINFFDTANTYSLGGSEEFLGHELWNHLPRAAAVITTKASGRMREGPNGAGLSRKTLFTEIEGSLRRLRTDYIDIYMIHRWDPVTPIEETMEALHDIVKAGKARYIGASSMFAWQLAKADAAAARNNGTRFISMQNHWNLLYREEEREMVPLCTDLGIGITPWSPLARGRLARKPSETSARGQSDAITPRLYDDGDGDAGREIIDAVGAAAAAAGVSRATIAIAWLLSRPAVAAPVIGATRAAHIDSAIAAVGLKLDPEVLATLEQPYRPREIVGIS